MPDVEKVYTLTFRLLRKDKSIDEVFGKGYAPGEEKALTELPWTQAEGARVFVGQIYQNSPSWLKFLVQDNSNLPNIFSGGGAAIVFIPVEERLIAVSFGHAHIALNLDSFERQFGLRVTLNAVPRKNLRTLDLATPDAVTFQRRIQASKDSDLSAFGVNIYRDLARVAGGTPRDKKFASFVAGKDSLSLTCKISPDLLQAKCQEVLAMYNEETYQADYRWIDNLRRVQQTDIKEQLDACLSGAVNALMNGEISDLHLAPPEIVDYTEGSLLHYNGFGSHGKDFYRLSIEDYISELSRCGFSGTIDDIKAHHRVFAAKDGTETLSEKWRIYDCFVFETLLTQDNGRSQKTYVFFAGEWYEIEASFKNRIETFYKKLKRRAIIPETTAANEKELIEKLIERTDLVKLDCEKINPQDVNYAYIEPCDFYSNQKQFIHLKDGHSSGPISHLWMQGIVSAEAFASDKKFRQTLRKKVKEIKAGFEVHLPDGRTEPVRSDYEIVYGVMRQPYANGDVGLPFFSKVSLQSAVERLEQLGFKVSINLIKKNNTEVPTSDEEAQI